MEVFKKKYVTNNIDNTIYNEIVEKLTSAWSWDSIDTGTNPESINEIYTKFYIGNAYLQIAKDGGKYMPTISVWFNNKTDSYIYSTSTGSILLFSYCKTSKTLLIHTLDTSSSNEVPSYNNGAIIMIGSATNMLTESKENVMSIFTNSTINNYTVNSYNKIFIPSTDITSYSNATFGPIIYNSDVELTMLTPANTMYSQVIMDDIYIVNRCNLTAPSIGECILNGKKYFMYFHIWVPYE